MPGLFRWFSSISFYIITSFLLAATSASAQNMLETGIGELSLIGCTSSGSSLNITGTGSMHSNKAYFNSETTLEEMDMLFDVRIVALDSSGNYSFGIGKTASTAGTMVKFHGTPTNSLISVYKLNGTVPTFASQIPIPFNLSPGTDYKIRVGRRVRHLIIEVFPADSSNYFYNDSLTYPTPSWGLLWGKPFIGCEAGSISVSGFLLSTPFNTSPRLAAWGDSFIEGNSLSDPAQRYISLIKDSIGHQNISILGRGGETSTSINSRFPKENLWFSGAKYALVAIGVNDSNFTVWKNNMQKYMDSLKKNNVIPIIATLSPRSDRIPFIIQVNDWIRNDYNGAYIDISKAISPTGTYWTSGMSLVDGIHPSVAGHQAIYDRIKIEAPYIFRDIAAFAIDFFNETTFENVSSNLEYSNTSNFLTANPGNTQQINVVPGETIYFRDTTTTPGIHILYDILPAPERPSPPSNPIVDAGTLSFDWTNNPAFGNVADYEFSIDSGLTWTTCAQKPIINPGSPNVQLRVKATFYSFKSNVLYMDVMTEVASLNRSNILVYPNPVKDKLTIENVSKDCALHVYAADGRVIKSILLLSGTNIIETSDFPAGLYILAFNDGNTDHRFRILKQ
jgi:lysophospholipase L1-like esterase